MKYFEECFICPNCGTPLYKKSVMQDENIKEKRFCGRCGFDIAAAKTEALKQLEEQAKPSVEGSEENGRSSADKKVCNTYIKFVFENLEEVQTKLHRLVELEKEARTLMRELASEELILRSEVRW